MSKGLTLVERTFMEGLCEVRLMIGYLINRNKNNYAIKGYDRLIRTIMTLFIGQ